MQVIVKRDALEDLVFRLLSENRSRHSLDIADIPAKREQEPIEPTEQMSVQLTTDKPSVDDPEFVPTSIPELKNSAAAIAQEVPSNQIEYFYRLLHKILDRAIDKQISKEEWTDRDVEHESDQDLTVRPDEEEDDATLDDETLDDELREAISRVLDEQDLDDDEEELSFFERPDLPKLPGESQSVVDRAYEDAIEKFNTDVFRRNLLDPYFIDIQTPEGVYPFRIGYTKMVEELPNIVNRLISMTPSDSMRKIKSMGKDSDEYLEISQRLHEYIKPFLKDPSSVRSSDIMIGDANKIVMELKKKATTNNETDPQVFLSLVQEKKAEIQDPELALTVFLVGLKTYQKILEGETEEELVYDEEELKASVKQLVDDDEDLPEKQQKEADADAWTQIAKDEGFASAAGARQFAFKPMIKFMLQSESIDETTMSGIIHQAGVKFSDQISQMERKGVISSQDAASIKRSAKIGPDISGNEVFRDYFAIVFYQPFINEFIKKWKDYTRSVLSGMNIDDPKDTIVKMLVGETSPTKEANQRKILAVMTKREFRTALGKARAFATRREEISNFALSYALMRLNQPAKVKGAIKKALQLNA